MFSVDVNGWCRVRVEEVVNDNVLVQRIDHGDVTSMPASQTRPFLDELMSFPPQAFSCKLSGDKITEWLVYTDTDK